jgi:hypothetical protein
MAGVERSTVADVAGVEHNGSVYMSAETIAVVISTAGLLLGFVSAFAWMIRRSDAQFERLETRLGDRITGVERELVTRITGVERELVEVKIAVARIEGPPRHLIPVR